MMPRVMFGCVACFAVGAMVMYSLALASPAWSGYYINDPKCENKDGCSEDRFNTTAPNYAKGEDVPKSWLKYQYHGVFLFTRGTAEAGMDYAKEHLFKTDAQKKAAEKDCTNNTKALNNHCTWSNDNFACTCTFPETDKWTEYMKKQFKDIPKDYCKNVVKYLKFFDDKTFDDLQEDSQPLELAKKFMTNAFISRCALISACCLHFIAMLLGYVGAVTVLPALGIVAAVCNLLGVALGITGLMTGLTYGYYSFTFLFCGSLEWYKYMNTTIPNQDEQLRMLAMSGYFCIVGVAFSVFSTYGACFAAFTSKKAREQTRPDSAYNKF